MGVEERRVAVVVEDDEDIRGLLEAVLQQSGFLVHSASDGASGVEMVFTHQPELVTLDLGLPDIDGFEVARRIRGMSDAHVLMLSARAEEIDMVIGLESGADDYMTKPFRPRELRARVEAIMRRRHGALKREQPQKPVAPVDGRTDAPAGPAEVPAAEEPDAGTFVSASDARAVEVHVGNLRRKLGDSAHDPRWIETVRGIGYRAALRR